MQIIGQINNRPFSHLENFGFEVKFRFPAFFGREALQAFFTESRTAFKRFLHLFFWPLLFGLEHFYLKNSASCLIARCE